MVVEMVDVDNDTVGAVLATMLQQPGPAVPVLIVQGVDRAGIDRVGALPLDYPPEAPREAQRLSLHGLGKKAATWEPYFARLHSISFLQKATLNLQTIGLRDEEEAALMTIFSVAEQAFTTNVFTAMTASQGTLAGVRCVLSNPQPHIVDTSLARELIQAFVQSYRQYAPKHKAN